MADNSLIEWTDTTWQIVTGCSVVSPGCTNCYAMKLAGTRMKNHPTRAGLTIDTKAGPVWNGQVRFNEAELTKPLSWTRPRKIFVAAHGDLFHNGVTDAQLDMVFAVAALCPQHTFQILTKRPERMRAYLETLWPGDDAGAWAAADARMTAAVNEVLLRSGKSWGKCGSTSTAITTRSRGTGGLEPSMLRQGPDQTVERLVGWHPEPRWMTVSAEFADKVRHWLMPYPSDFGWGLKLWPLPNVWLGVSVEDQTRADERIPILLDTPAAVRWISAEPLLGPIDLCAIQAPRYVPEDHEMDWKFDALETGEYYFYDAGGGFTDGGDGPYREHRLDWIVVGGESGPGARPMHPDWARRLRDQCATAGVAFLFKQWGSWEPRDAWQPGQKAPPMRAIKLDGSPVPDDVAPQDVGGWRMACVGKKAAGRLLDGQLHDGYPATSEARG